MLICLLLRLARLLGLVLLRILLHNYRSSSGTVLVGPGARTRVGEVCSEVSGGKPAHAAPEAQRLQLGRHVHGALIVPVPTAVPHSPRLASIFVGASVHSPADEDVCGEGAQQAQGLLLTAQAG